MASGKKHPPELRERGVGLVFELRKQEGSTRGSIRRVAEQLGVNAETLRNWVRQAEVDQGQRLGTSTGMRSGFRSWNAKYVSCAALTRF